MGLTSVPSFATTPSAVPQLAPQGKPALTDSSARPRTIITTDSEADDMNSFMRLLYYTNDLDVDGLVYTSSVHHWEGDGEHTLKQAQDLGLITSFKGETAGSDARSDDAKRWRWEPLGWMETKITKEYNQIYPNLLKHDPNYPSPAELWSKVAVGNVTWENDFKKETAGSNLIKNALLDDDPRPLYLEAWGGTNTIARALLSIEEQNKGAANWDAIRDRVAKKAVIAAIGQQDNAYKDYISKAWPTIKTYDFGKVFGGFSSYTKSQVPPSLLPYYKASFWAPNIKYGHGPVLNNYGLIGDGTYFEGEGDNPGWQPGQVKDVSTWKMFNFLGGFERLDWTGEGDTPSFMFLLPSGLRFLDDPSLGGWGGRLTKSPTVENGFEGTTDLNPFTSKGSGPYTTIRWMDAVDKDFAARADWGITSSYRRANHAPIVKASLLDTSGIPGKSVKLSLSASDPDHDPLRVKWSVYTDASTTNGTATVVGNGRTARVTIPATASAGQRIVVVAAVSDNGAPSLTRYAEFVVSVN